MKADLAKSEHDFFASNLKSNESRIFFRRWRRLAAISKDAWADIRKDEFLVDGKKIVGAVLITSLRNHLTDLQGGFCCYCRQALQGIGWAKPIDHVLPKDKFPRFTFHYRNLAVACFNCNQTKKNANWSGWSRSRRGYIPEKRCSTFFHPRHHDYDDHVRYLHIATNGASLSIYYGITEQGKQLCAKLLNKSAGRQLVLSANPRLEKALTRIRTQVDAMEKHAVAGHMEDFLEALEEFAAPGI